jgi:hypothetical protein
MATILLDGLDSLIEYLIPAAKEYPIALVIYILIIVLPLVLIVLAIRAFFQKKEGG